MMFEVLLNVMDRAYEIPTLNAPTPFCQAKFGGLERFDETKPMILPLSTERPFRRPIS